MKSKSEIEVWDGARYMQENLRRELYDLIEEVWYDPISDVLWLYDPATTMWANRFGHYHYIFNHNLFAHLEYIGRL